MQRSNNVHRLLIRSPRWQWLPVRRKIVTDLTAGTIGLSSIPTIRRPRDDEAGDILCMKGFCFAWDGD